MMGPPTVICERNRSRSLQDRHDVRAQIVVVSTSSKPKRGSPGPPDPNPDIPMNRMHTTLLTSVLTLAASSLLAAESGPKSEVLAAAKKLAGQKNYGWTTTVTVPEGARWRPGPTEGKTEKDGFTWISMARRDTTTEAVLKGGKGAIKTDAGWKSLDEAAQDDGSGGFNAMRFAARMLQEFKTPAAQAEDLVAKAKELKLADGVYAGELTEEGAKELMRFRRGGEGPEISGAKGSVRFWVKDGVLSKYEFKLEGKMSFNNNEMDVSRTTTVEIKDVGTTKLSVPEEAAKKAA